MKKLKTKPAYKFCDHCDGLGKIKNADIIAQANNLAVPVSNECPKCQGRGKVRIRRPEEKKKASQK